MEAVGKECDMTIFSPGQFCQRIEVCEEKGRLSVQKNES